MNDRIVLYTQVQANYLQRLYERELQELIDTEKAAGRIRSRNDLTQRQYNQVLNSIRRQAIVFRNGDQNLASGAIARETAPRGGVSFTLAKDLQDNAEQETRLERPAEVGVGAIANLAIGRGDGMTINNVASNENGPRNSIFIFDGIDFSVLDFDAHSTLVNQGVWDAWQDNVLDQVRETFEDFLEVADPDLLDEAFTEIRGNRFNQRNENFKYVNSVGELFSSIEDSALRSEAWKQVLADLPVSVHQMGGSENNFSQTGRNDETRVSQSDINNRIEQRYLEIRERSRDQSNELYRAQPIDWRSSGSWIVERSSKSFD